MFQPKRFYFGISHPLNILEGFSDLPDETLTVLQKGVNYSLTPQQYAIAKFSALELAKTKEINLLDLVELWSGTPALSEFAAILRRCFLPGN